MITSGDEEDEDGTGYDTIEGTIADMLVEEITDIVEKRLKRKYQPLKKANTFVKESLEKYSPIAEALPHVPGGVDSRLEKFTKFYFRFKKKIFRKRNNSNLKQNVKNISKKIDYQKTLSAN